MLKLNAVLNYKEHSLRESKCAVDKVVELSEAEFADLQHNLMKDRDFIRDNIDMMRRDQSGVHHCLLALGEGSDNGILIYSEGTGYARCSAPVPHARSILQMQNMSPSLLSLNQKLSDFADYAAGESERQLMGAGRAELRLNEMGRNYGLELHGGQVLWDTATAMVAERLNHWELDMEVDKDVYLLTDYDIQNVIAASERKIPFDPLIAPSDQEWGVKRVCGVEDLMRQFQHGNWSARTGFVYENLAFVQRISGGDEWLTLKRDRDLWHSFDSISMEHMLQKHGEEHCRGYIEDLAVPPAQTPGYEIAPTM